MLDVFNKTDNDVQFLVKGKDSVVYAYHFEPRHVYWYDFMDKTDYLIRYPNTNFNRDTMNVLALAVRPTKIFSKDSIPRKICDSPKQYNPNEIHGTFVYSVPEEYRPYKKYLKEWINKYVDTNVNSLTILYGKERIFIDDPLMIKKFFISEWWKIRYIPRLRDDSEIKITKKKLKKWKKKFDHESQGCPDQGTVIISGEAPTNNMLFSISKE